MRNSRQGIERLSQPPLDALLTEGSLAGKAGDFDHAIACFRLALKQAPQHAGVMLYLSKALGLSFHFREAEAWLQKAVRLMPKDERVLQMAAENYLEWDRPMEAIPWLRRPATNHPHSVNAWVRLGRALERANQAASAEEASKQATRLAPRNPEVLWLRGRLAQRAGDAEAAAAAFLEGLAQGHEPAIGAELWYALAATYESMGKFGEAWKAASEAKLLQREEAITLCEAPEAWRREIERIRELGHLAKERENGAETPVAILCGYPRSGTTLLGQIIAGHPQVTYADEVLAFARILRLGENLGEPAREDWFLHTNAIQKANLRGEYVRCLEAQLKFKWGRSCLVDKNPAVTRFLSAFWSVMPGTKVIFPLRDPRDVAISCYLRPFPVNAFTAHFNRLETLVAHLQANYAVWQATCAALPIPHLEVRYEQVVRSPEETGRAVCEFLGIEASALPADHRELAGRSFINSPTYAEVLQPLHQRAVGRWRAYEEQFGSSLPVLNQLAREQGYE
jgi:Flp pilus assembly protein TadD